jgi:hypothetical protein
MEDVVQYNGGLSYPVVGIQFRIVTEAVQNKYGYL